MSKVAQRAGKVVRPVPPGSGSAWQSAAFGTQRSWVQIPPPRPSKKGLVTGPSSASGHRRRRRPFRTPPRVLPAAAGQEAPASPAPPPPALRAAPPAPSSAAGGTPSAPIPDTSARPYRQICGAATSRSMVRPASGDAGARRTRTVVTCARNMAVFSVWARPGPSPRRGALLPPLAARGTRRGGRRPGRTPASVHRASSARRSESHGA
jgi:hypothetical protein